MEMGVLAMSIGQLRTKFTNATKIIQSRHLVSMEELAADGGEYALNELERKHKEAVDTMLPLATELFVADTFGQREIRIVTALIEPTKVFEILRLMDKIEAMIKEKEEIK